MKPTKKKPARVKARVMLLLHSKSGSYNDYELHANATDAAIAKMADECTNRVAILSKVSVLPRDPATQAAMVEQVDKVITHGINRWLAGDKDACSNVARAVLAALNLVEAKP